ncbi:iron complex transport system substrate-binding protein [Oceanobacillus limi]|uniref:Iron complex transport system substrate-binding protein n=1 Tax=Oceanobacillus limi TaxID=930131 RepID=A0A1I0DM15_9BACI|nr:iron-hydroxamate ABC transporter substrate-binding protein [Oceanobacillus limi]SET33245.1 iron complex transport system substrate-binding protein [Oceanobacillus limi]
MYRNIKNNVFFYIVIIGLLLLISACGNESSEETNEDSAENSTENAEVTLNSEMGEVTIPTNADRVIAPYHEDALLALGITPVAKWVIGSSVQDYLEEDLGDLPGIEWNLPLEQVLNHEPDLIILENALDSYEGTYDDYNKIASTYVMTEEVTKDWRKQVELFGKLFGKESEAEEVLGDYEQQVEEASQQIEDAIGDESIAAIWVTGEQFYLFEQDRHSANVFYNELGINQPSLVTELGDAEAQWNPLSIEKLSELDADHVFLLAEEGEQGIELLENSNVWQSTPAAENGNVYRLNDPSNWTNQGLIASEQTINDIVNMLVD